MQLMASRIANVALPSSGYNIFSKLRDSQFKRYGNFGIARDPRTALLPPDQYISGNIPVLPTEADMDSVHKKNTFNTRAEIEQRSLGMANMSMASQMRVAQMDPAFGQASATKAGLGDHSGHSHGPNGECATGFQAGGANANWMNQNRAGNPQVEDNGWAQTLGQIVGSGMLTQEQLQRASYANVYSMVRMDGGTEADKQEMTYYLQRMIMEGYVRGYDLTRDIQNEYGGTFKIQLTDGAVCSTTSTSIIGCGGMGYVQFRNGFWQNAGDGTKLALFYHELGHEILNRPHNMVPSSLMGYDRFNNSWQSNASTYDQLMDELFGNSSGVNRTVAGPLATQQEIQQWLTNQGVTTGGGPLGNPNGPNNTTNNNINYQLNPTQINPMTGTPSTITSGQGPSNSSPENNDKTPVAGMLPNMSDSTGTFAAGLADAASKSSGMLRGLAGALQRFKSG